MPLPVVIIRFLARSDRNSGAKLIDQMAHVYRKPWPGGSCLRGGSLKGQTSVKWAQKNISDVTVFLWGYGCEGSKVRNLPGGIGAYVPGYLLWSCLLYTSDAADDLLSGDVGGSRVIIQ